MCQKKQQFIDRIQAAGKNLLPDLIIKNAKIVDVFNGALMDGAVAIHEGFIVGIGDYEEGKSVIDAKGKYLSPSLIDAHVHIESSMLTPLEFSKILLKHGVTTAITDPHEIANVSGVSGIQYMLDAANEAVMTLYTMLPSSVPAAPFEHSGAVLNSEELQPFFNDDRVLGLAEVMDFPSVKNTDDKMIEKLWLTRHHGGLIDGHLAGHPSAAINIYKTAGITTDHEAVSIEEAKDRLSRGMVVMIREGSVAKNLKALLPLVTDRNSRRFLLCTDDKHTDDLIAEGSVDHVVRLAIKEGLDPFLAIQMASLNTAEAYNLKDQGAVAPGYEANLVLLDRLEDFSINKVICKGETVVENDIILNDMPSTAVDIDESKVRHSVNLPLLSERSLLLPVKDQSADIIGVIPNQIVTRHLIEEVTAKDGYFQTDIAKDQLKMAVIERHRASGHIGLGIVKGFQFNNGAIATTVAHDSHNVVTAGTNDSDILLAIEMISASDGGLAVVSNGEILATLPLPIAGLMTDVTAEALNTQLIDLNKAFEKIGFTADFNPFLTLSFLALPVIPELKLTDQGLFNVTQFRFI